jgi:hypothetical protein
MNKKNIKYILVSVGVLAIVAMLKFELFPNKKEGDIVVMSPSYMEDLSSDKVLVGGSHNVFVGKVVRQMGNKSIRPELGAETQFEVHAVYNIKGELKGNVIVDQVGGYKNGKFYMVQSDLLVGGGSIPEDYLLKPGSTYLFASRKDDKEDWNIISAPPYDWQLISKDSKLGDIQLRDLVENNKRVKELEAAYPNEILPQSDIMNGTTHNSYASLHGQAIHPSLMRQGAVF